MRAFWILALGVALAVTVPAPAPAVTPATADPTPLDCDGFTQSPGPLVGDGAGSGDAMSAATVITYGCYSGELAGEPDVDGYRLYTGPVRVYVGLMDDDGDCVHVTWFLGPPSNNDLSRWLCDHDSHEVIWDGIYPMRLQLWYGPLADINGPTPYRIGIMPYV